MKSFSKVSKRYIITAGGTGGHIFPAAAIAEELRDRGCEILFVGNRNSMEEEIAQKLSLSFAYIDVQKLYRSFTFKHILFPYKLLKSILISGKIIKSFHPDGCIGTGGFVSFPVILRAIISKIPVFLQEQNSVPGLTTKMLSRYAASVFTGYEEANKFLPESKSVYTGNPLYQLRLLSAARSCSLSTARSCSKQGGCYRDRISNFQQRAKGKDRHISILIMGGSQGARVINERVLQLLPELFSNSSGTTYTIYWQCGKDNFESVKEQLQTTEWKNKFVGTEHCSVRTISDAELRYNLDIDNAVEGNRVVIFPFTDKMSSLYEQVDIAITRAGAISLAELEACGIPAIIIPIPFSAGNHQYLNAKSRQNNKGGIMIEQANLNNRSIMDALRVITEDYGTFSDNCRNSSHVTASKTIAELIINWR